MFKTYYQMAKPGIVYGNLLTASAGYLFASHWHKPATFIFMLVGSSFIIGGACVLNNIIDRDIDRKMKRTEKRALVSGKVSIKNALIYASSLELVGCILLGIFTNLLTLSLALAGLFFYVVVYGWAKRNTVYSTLIGAISGSLPPLIGYAAFSDNITSAAVIIFLMMVCWQLAHFYAIGLYREKEYREADLPIWPVVKGAKSTKVQILGSILLFSVLSVFLFFYGYVGYIYLLFMLVIGFGWYAIANKKSRFMTIEKWGRSVFLQSLIIILLTSLALAVGPILH